MTSRTGPESPVHTAPPAATNHDTPGAYHPGGGTELSAEVVRVLAILNKGGRIEGTRTFPHPHRFILVKPDGSRYAQPLATATVATMVTLRLVDVAVADRRTFDDLTYRITERGVEALLAGGRA